MFTGDRNFKKKCSCQLPDPYMESLKHSPCHCDALYPLDCEPKRASPQVVSVRYLTTASENMV